MPVPPPSPHLPPRSAAEGPGISHPTLGRLVRADEFPRAVRTGVQTRAQMFSGLGGWRDDDAIWSEPWSVPGLSSKHIERSTHA